jgi:amidophosphoribosyltransferase
MCGIVGVFGHTEAANITYLGLHALQHRGQESAGIVAGDGHRLYTERHMGLVSDVFSADVLARLPGRSAIGHVRYSTTGRSDIVNAQPLSVQYAHGPIAIAHNGNLVNASEIRRELELEGSIFQTTTDTEVIVHLLARVATGDTSERVITALSRVSGAYSLVGMTPTQLIAVRDARGFRPLVLGQLKDGAYVVASETCAFDLIEATLIREVEPGELIIVDDSGLRSVKLPSAPAKTACVFERVYFARPDSVFGGRSVYRTREALGRRLAQEYPVEADVVVPVPDSGLPSAIGYARASGTPYEMGLIRSHYVGRTFIEPAQSIRHFGVKLKLNAVREVLEGKRVVIVDDSLVRGTTSRKIVKMVRAAGAKEVHLRISSPPVRYPCFYGIDTPTRKELIASSHTPEEIAKYVTCDTLGFLSREGMLEGVGGLGGGFCDACFSGAYPVLAN